MNAVYVIYDIKNYIIKYVPGGQNPQSSPFMPFGPSLPGTPGIPGLPGGPGNPGKPLGPGGPRLGTTDVPRLPFKPNTDKSNGLYNSGTF